jgi:hypothetical protein
MRQRGSQRASVLLGAQRAHRPAISASDEKKKILQIPVALSLLMQLSITFAKFHFKNCSRTKYYPSARITWRPPQQRRPQAAGYARVERSFRARKSAVLRLHETVEASMRLRTVDAAPSCPPATAGALRCVWAFTQSQPPLWPPSRLWSVLCLPMHSQSTSNSSSRLQLQRASNSCWVSRSRMMLVSGDCRKV